MNSKHALGLISSALVLGMLLALFGVYPVLAANPGDVLIVEVVYNPSGTDTGREWVELYNDSGAQVDLSGWTLCDNTSCETLSSILDAGRSIIVIDDANELGSSGYWACTSNPKCLGLGAPIGNGLADNDMLVLFDDLSNEIDQMNWGTPSSGWTYYQPDLWNPGPTVAEGSSLKRSPSINTDNDLPSDFTEDTSPSPCIGPNVVTLSAFTASADNGFCASVSWPLAALASTAALTIAELLWARRRRLV